MKKIDFDIIPLVIAVVLILVSIVIVSISDYALSLKHYLWMGCVLISLFLYSKKRMLYYLVFGLTLLVGIFGLLDFYYSIFKVGIGNFGINPVMAGLLIAHVALVFQMAEKMDAD